jgi:glycosyltransferase involved in cell wall biosynthesis
MKVMTAMYTMKKGGAYDRFKMMIESFLEKQWEVHCLSLTPIQIDHSFFHNHIIYFPFKKADGFLAKLVVISLFPPWAIWIAWRYKNDLIIAFGSLYAFLQSLSKWSLKRPMVTLIRGSLNFGSKMQDVPISFQYLNRLLENLGIFSSDRIITNNVSARDEILKNVWGRKKIDVQVLYNNIPPMNIHEPETIFQAKNKCSIPEDSKVLVTAGILNRGKNLEALIECLPKIEVKNIYILIVGNGSTKADFHYKDFLQKLAKELGVERKVIFTGWLGKEELWKIYLASDLFILPSLSEGMPNAMLEALGSGLPCMGSDIPGIQDILKYDELLFDPLDEKTLAEKIQRFFSDRQFSDRVKKLCQERKEAFLFNWKEEVFQMVTMGFESAYQRE